MYWEVFPWLYGGMDERGWKQQPDENIGLFFSVID